MSPTHVSKSPHGGKAPAFEPQDTIKIWSNLPYSRTLINVEKIFGKLVLRVGSSFSLNSTCNTSPKPHLQKVLPCRHLCHTWDLGLGTWNLCEVASLNFHP